MVDNVDMLDPFISDDNRRQNGRIRSQDLITRLGEVQDLSSSGLRIIGAVKPPEAGSVVHLAITHPDGGVRVKARIVWVRTLPDGDYESGRTFEDVSATTRSGIGMVAGLAMSFISVDYHS